jgi:cytochrome c
MENFQLMVATSVLSALLLIFGVKTAVDMNAGHGPTGPGYELPAAAPQPEVAAAPAAEGGESKPAAEGETPADGGKSAAAPAAGGGDVVALLAKASADNGKSGFSKCKACHQAEKGKPSTVGPNLWGVVNRPIGSLEGFPYSPAMKGKGGEWTFENLSQFLRSPKGYVPGTKMVFNGIADPAAEADMIAYLATLADTPVPLPK